jgi:hypothetical protein
MQLPSSLTYMLIIAVALIFIVDSSLTQDYGLYYIFFICLLGIILFVSGFWFACSSNNLRDLWKKFLVSVYLPYIVIVSIAVLAHLWLSPSLQSWLIALTPLVMFPLMIPAGFGYFWLIPMLLTLLLLLTLLHRFVPNDKIKITVVAGIWILTFLALLYNSPLRTIDEFPICLAVFFLGYFAGEGKLNKFLIQAKKELFIVIIFALIGVTGLYSYFAPATTFQSELERLLYFYVSAIALAFAVIPILIYVFRKTKTNKYVTLLSSATLLVYLFVPYTSALVGYLLYRQTYYISVDTLAFELIRIPLAILTAVAVYLLIRRLEKYPVKSFTAKAKKLIFKQHE